MGFLFHVLVFVYDLILFILIIIILQTNLLNFNQVTCGKHDSRDKSEFLADT